jgi:hypothetical protein
MATQLVQQLTDQATALVREELAATRVDVVRTARWGAAGVIAFYGLGALTVTVGALVALVGPAWLAALVTAALLLAVAGAAAMTGKGQIRKPFPEEAVASGRRDVAAVRDAIRRR